MSDDRPDRRPLMFPMLLPALSSRKKLGDTVELLPKIDWNADRRRHGAGWQMSSSKSIWQTHFSGYENFDISATVEAAFKGVLRQV